MLRKGEERTVWHCSSCQQGYSGAYSAAVLFGEGIIACGSAWDGIDLLTSGKCPSAPWIGSWNSLVTEACWRWLNSVCTVSRHFLCCSALFPHLQWISCRLGGGQSLEQGTHTDQRDITSCSVIKAVRKEVVRDVHGFGVWLPDSRGNCWLSVCWWEVETEFFLLCWLHAWCFLY